MCRNAKILTYFLVHFSCSSTEVSDIFTLFCFAALWMMANPLRPEVVRLYKNLLYLGREYPKGSNYFKDRLRAAFIKNKSVQDPEQIKAMIARGEYVARELEALYYLRKYRAMKKRYYEE
uniref:Complex 1 LYR protein domain-containing protein n=2 Tax=Xiphophorus couchianus TaxID=32473 RepID=A0A3B5MBZ1_9TELE